MEDIDYLYDDINSYTRILRMLETENRRLRAVLANVEWVRILPSEVSKIAGKVIDKRCPWCYHCIDIGHSPTCERQAVLEE